MKRKYGGLVRLAILLIIVPVAWHLSISRTVDQWRKYRIGQSEIRLLEGMDNISGAMIELHNDLLNSGDILKALYPEIEANGLNVDLYVPYLTQTQGSTTLRSAEIVLRGEFISLLKIIRFLENDIPQVSLRSIEFASSNNPREKEKQLRATLIVQQITRREQ